MYVKALWVQGNVEEKNRHSSKDPCSCPSWVVDMDMDMDMDLEMGIGNEATGGVELRKAQVPRYRSFTHKGAGGARGNGLAWRAEMGKWSTYNAAWSE